MADEKPHRGQEIDHAHRNALCFGRTNDRTHREIWAEEIARLRHDQVRLEVLPSKGRTVEIRKDQSVRGVRQRRRITGLVRPGLKMHGLGGTDADQDSQHFDTAGPLRHRRVEAVATLLDGRKVESRRVGDCLDVVGRGQVGIGPGDCRELPAVQARDGLWKLKPWIKVGILGAAAVASPPTGIERELHEVCQPERSTGARRAAARQSSELFETHRLRTLGGEIRVEEVLVGKLILGVVVNVLIHIPIEDRKRSGVGWIPTSAWNFAVLDSPEFVVLHPEIGLEDFRGGREPKQSGICLLYTSPSPRDRG